jgi:hypothetical protein
LKIPVSGSFKMTNLTNRNAVPPNSIAIFALYPADSTLCSYLDEEDGVDSLPFTVNGAARPSCPILLMTNGTFYGNATLSPGSSFSPGLSWSYYSFINNPPFNVFLLAANQEKAAIAQVNTVMPIALIIAVSDRGSNPRQCEFSTGADSNFFVFDTYPAIKLTC